MPLRIHCPILFLSGSNDGHGKMDLAFTTLDLTNAPVRSAVFTPNCNHHVEPEEAKSLSLWMDLHLKGVGQPWPETPKIELAGSGMPQIRLTPANPDQVAKVDLYYCLNTDWPPSRFWRTVADVRREGDAFVGRAALYAPGRHVLRLWQRHLSIGRSNQLADAQEGGRGTARSTAYARASAADRCDGRRNRLALRAGLRRSASGQILFHRLEGPDGQRGFTLNPKMYDYREKMSYYFGTCKVGDPQFRNAGEAALLIDVLAAAIPEKLTIKLSRCVPRALGEDYDFDATAAIASWSGAGAKVCLTHGARYEWSGRSSIPRKESRCPTGNTCRPSSWWGQIRPESRRCSSGSAGSSSFPHKPLSC